MLKPLDEREYLRRIIASELINELKMSVNITIGEIGRFPLLLQREKLDGDVDFIGEDVLTKYLKNELKKSELHLSKLKDAIERFQRRTRVSKE